MGRIKNIVKSKTSTYFLLEMMTKLNTKYTAALEENNLKRRNLEKNITNSNLQTSAEKSYQETLTQKSICNQSEVKKFPPQPQSQNIQNEDLVEDDLNGDQRDILDWCYISIRVLILCSVIFFYSTLTRYCLTVGLGMILYLHNNGFFGQNEQNQGKQNQEYSCKNVLITFVSSFFTSLLPNNQSIIF